MDRNINSCVLRTAGAPSQAMREHRGRLNLAPRRWALWCGASLVAGASVLGAAIGAGGGPAAAQDTGSALVVTTTRDGGAGSLRAAIAQANQRPGSTITFAIPRSDTGFHNGVWTILLHRSLPSVSAPRTTIDGTSQTRFGGNTNRSGPEIELFGGAIETQVLVPTPEPTPTATPTSTPTPSGMSTPTPTLVPTPTPTLVPTPTAGATPTPSATATPGPSFEEARPNGLTVEAPFVTVRGLAIGGFKGNGIEFRFDNSRGSQSPTRLAGGNFGRVEACTIGLEAHGLRAQPNRGTGILAQTVVGTTVGSPQTERNLIAGNRQSLIATYFGPTSAPAGTFVTVQNNWFGVDATGEVLVPIVADADGRQQSSDVNVVSAMRFGGTRVGERNVIARSTVLDGSGTVQNNVFGFSASGRSVLVREAGLNIYRFSSMPGVLLVGGTTAAARNYTASCVAIAAAPSVVLQNNWLGWSPANFTTRNGLLASDNVQVGASPGDPAPASKGNRIAGPVSLFQVQAGTRAAATVRGNVLTGDPQHGGPLFYGNEQGYGTTPNDFRDADIGINGLQNAPVLGDARQGARGLQLSLGLDSRPSTSYVLDFYAFNPAARTWTPFASRPLRTAGSGEAILTATLPASPTRMVACTATDLATGATSPMSNLATVAPGEVLPEPTLVLSVARNFGAVGDTFMLYGRGLSRVTGVLFAGPRGPGGAEAFISAPDTIVDGQTIRATVPSGARSGSLTLVLAGGRRVRIEGSFAIIEAGDNDFFSQARVLSGESGAITDFFGRSGEPGEPAHAGQAPQRSKWFRWTAPRDGLAEWLLLASRNGNGFNGRIAAYTGSTLESLRPLASLAGSVSSYNNRQLDIQFAVRAGTAYYIAADSGYLADFTLAWRYATEIERSRAPKQPAAPSGPPPSIRAS